MAWPVYLIMNGSIKFPINFSIVLVGDLSFGEQNLFSIDEP